MKYRTDVLIVQAAAAVALVSNQHIVPSCLGCLAGAAALQARATGEAERRSPRRGGARAKIERVLLVDGVVAGVWHQRHRGRRVAITVEPLVELSAAQRRLLDEEASHVAAFLGGLSVLRFGSIAVGPYA